MPMADNIVDSYRSVRSAYAVDALRVPSGGDDARSRPRAPFRPVLRARPRRHPRLRRRPPGTDPQRGRPRLRTDPRGGPPLPADPGRPRIRPRRRPRSSGSPRASWSSATPTCRASRCPRSPNRIWSNSSRRTRESSSLCVLDGDDIVYVARVPARRIMTAAITVGTRFPAHVTSVGRVILAHLPARGTRSPAGPRRAAPADRPHDRLRGSAAGGTASGYAGRDTPSSTRNWRRGCARSPPRCGTGAARWWRRSTSRCTRAATRSTSVRRDLLPQLLDGGGRGSRPTSGCYRSSTSRFPRHRDTQIIIVSPASRSSSVSTESRWSGVPSRTSVSQVPQVPSVQENSTSTPGGAHGVEHGDVRGDGERPAALRQLDLELRVLARLLLLRLEPLDAQQPGRAPRLHRVEQRPGTAAVDQRALGDVVEHRRPGPAARSRPAGRR